MPLVTQDDFNLLTALLKEAEDNKYSRERYRAIVTAVLDERDLDSERRRAVFDLARALAKHSGALAPDRTEQRDLDEARQKLRDCALHLTGAPSWPVIRDRWPAPIAHEIARLHDELGGGRLAEDETSPDGALLQAKDAFEVLIKLTAIILLRVLMAQDQETADWGRRLIFRKKMTLGTWVEILWEGLKRYKSLSEDSKNRIAQPLRVLAEAAGDLLLGSAEGFVRVRNNTIGHGARALNPKDTAALVSGIVSDGQLKNLRGQELKLLPLTKLLDSLVARDVFVGLDLEGMDDGMSVPLTGAGATEHWLDDPRHRDAGVKVIPLFLRLADGTGLDLAPFLAGRICTNCGKRDVLLYDTVYQTRAGGEFDLQDYARGHKCRIAGIEAGDLGEALGSIVPEDAPDLEGESLKEGAVLEALDKARIDQNYLSPGYLRDDLRAFLETHDRGVFWLQAEAHIGKTTFVQGLAEQGIDAEPVQPRFAYNQKRFVVAYYCRKEYRTGLGGMIATLNRKLRDAYWGGDNVSLGEPSTGPVIEQRTPDSFVAWLQAWREFAANNGLAPKGAPLLVAIDGLDEADPPPDSPLDVLPRPEILPEGLYILLTSRPVGDPGTATLDPAPAFLKTRVEALYGAPA